MGVVKFATSEMIIFFEILAKMFFYRCSSDAQTLYTCSKRAIVIRFFFTRFFRVKINSEA